MFCIHHDEFEAVITLSVFEVSTKLIVSFI
jgi:hypothetical protein